MQIVLVAFIRFSHQQMADSSVSEASAPVLVPLRSRHDLGVFWGPHLQSLGTRPTQTDRSAKCLLHSHVMDTSQLATSSLASSVLFIDTLEQLIQSDRHHPIFCWSFHFDTVMQSSDPTFVRLAEKVRRYGEERSSTCDEKSGFFSDIRDDPSHVFVNDKTYMETEMYRQETSKSGMLSVGRMCAVNVCVSAR